MSYETSVEMKLMVCQAAAFPAVEQILKNLPRSCKERVS
jgi:NADPH-dependent ferric siderophore reductase